MLFNFLKSIAADPDPGSGAFSIPDPGSGIVFFRIPDLRSQTYIFENLMTMGKKKFYNSL
jgi:hypothetical protein